MTAYRYIAAELGGSRNKIADLHLQEVSWQRLKNGAGVFSAKLKLPPPVNELNRTLCRLYAQATDRATTCIYVMRNGTPMGAYAVQGQDYSSTDQTITISGAELFAYLRRRIVEDVTGDLDVRQDYGNWPMFEAVGSLISRANDIGLVVDIEEGGPILPATVAAVAGTTPEQPGTGWKGSETKWIGDIISEWANQDDAFDFRTDLTLSDPGPDQVFERRFILRETLGQGVDIVAKYGGLTAKAGGNVTHFNVKRRGDLRATDVIAVGATAGDKRFNGRATNAAFEPPTQRVIQNNEETSPTRLDASAQGVLDAAVSHEIVEIEMAAGSIDAEIGTFQPGDSFRFDIPPNTDALYVDGLSTTVKTLGFTVKVPTTESKEIVTFTLEDDGDTA